MAKGSLYKMNATSASNSQCKKLNATAVTDGKVMHASASTWFDNYPM